MDFIKQDLKQIKAQLKSIDEIQFNPSKRNSLPAPLNTLKGMRRKNTKLADIGHGLCVTFVWVTGDELERRSIYGWLFKKAPQGLIPVCRMDYHPSHKSLHIVINCEDDRGLLKRGLPGCKELQLKLDKKIDPDKDTDRIKFIELFCTRLNIKFGGGDLL